MHKASKRASETSAANLAYRKQQDRVHKASKRASETSEQTLHIENSRTECTKQAREPVKLASKPCIYRKQQDRAHKASKRTNVHYCAEGLHFSAL